MIDNKLISVIVPIYKVEKYLDKCIQSILNQKYRNLEIILVDDGSPDKCGQMCEEYCLNDNRIKVIHKENGGLSSARNAGLRACNGEFIIFIDSDDWIDECMISELYNIQQEYDSDIVVCNFKQITDESNFEIDKDYEIINFDKKSVINKIYDRKIGVQLVVAWNKLYRRDMFFGEDGKLDIIYPDGKIHEDEFTTYKLLYKAERCTYISKQYYYYRIRPASITNEKYNKKRLDIIEAFQERLEFASIINNDEFFIKTLETMSYLCIDNNIKCYKFLKGDKKTRNIINQLTKKYVGCYIERAEINKIKKILLSFSYKSIPLYLILNKVYEIMKKFIRLDVKDSFEYYIEYMKLFFNQKKKKIFHLSTPSHGNMGDHAIVFATNNFLHDYYKDYMIVEVYRENIYKYTKMIKRFINKDDIIVLIGGGNMGNLWEEEERERRYIIDSFRNNKIISMPQTISFSRDLAGRIKLEQSRKVYNNHPDLTIIAREKKSFEIMKNNFTKCNILLNPDMVLYLYDRFKVSFNNRKYIMTCFRNDKEGIIGENKEFVINEIQKQFGKIFVYDTVVNKRVYMKQREKELYDMFSKFRNAKLVITDRLHGMVFSAITKTPCIVTKSLDHKITGTYEWIRDLNYIKFVDNFNMDEIRQYINELLELKEYSSIDFKKKYFDKLSSSILGE